MKLGRTAARTDTGRRRLRNEDTYLCEPPLFAVADGMGGAQAGEVASRLAAGALAERPHDGLGEDTLVELIQEANARIWARSLDDPQTAGMGTTATVAIVDEQAGKIAIGHVGDSRAYRYREGELEQLTADHSLVAELERSGRLTREEAEAHPQRAVITRALGTEPDVDVDTLTVEAIPGDLFLLCSDGLTTMVRDVDIAAAVSELADDPDRLAETLVGAANAAGGDDNITVIVLEIVADDAVPAIDPDRETAEHAVPEPAPAAAPEPVAGVRRHGAGAGGRLAALAVVLGAFAIAAVVLLLSLR